MKNLILVMFSALLLIEVGDKVFWGAAENDNCSGYVLEVKNNKLLYVVGQCLKNPSTYYYMQMSEVLRVEK